MKNLIKKNSYIILTLTIIVTVFLDSCTQMSESITDKSIGLNGSFEQTKDGIPFNWLLYTQKTVKTGDFDIIIDTTNFKEGKQSLKFFIRECSSQGGRFSPGIAQEIKANPNENYNVSFWIRNIGCEFIVKIRGVSAFKGENGPVLKSKETIDIWRKFEYKFTIPEKMNALRFEMNILSPGSFWIDDIKIERIGDKIEN